MPRPRPRQLSPPASNRLPSRKVLDGVWQRGKKIPFIGALQEHCVEVIFLWSGITWTPNLRLFSGGSLLSSAGFLRN